MVSQWSMQLAFVSAIIDNLRNFNVLSMVLYSSSGVHKLSILFLNLSSGGVLDCLPSTRV